MNHYETNFYMIKIHNFSLAEIENMIPYEKEIYVLFIKKYIDEEKKQMEEMKNKK